MPQLEYHKDEFDHWSEDDLPYDSEDSDWDSLREVMNDERDEEPEYGPGEEKQAVTIGKLSLSHFRFTLFFSPTGEEEREMLL